MTPIPSDHCYIPQHILTVAAYRNDDRLPIISFSAMELKRASCTVQLIEWMRFRYPTFYSVTILDVKGDMGRRSAVIAVWPTRNEWFKQKPASFFLNVEYVRV